MRSLGKLNQPSIQIININTFAAYNSGQTNCWYGRASMKDIGGGIWCCMYSNSASHPDCVYSQIMVKFSDDYGETWSNENEYLDGTSISGFPLAPIGAEWGDVLGPGEPWLMVMPNGDLICAMWKVKYGNTDGGTYTSRSTDGGLTWSTPAQVAFGNTVYDDNTLYMTDDDFVYNGVVYTVMRRNVNTPAQTYSENLLVKSEDNGVTWDYVSHITQTGVNPSIEIGLEYVGNNTIVAHSRGYETTTLWTDLLKSTDMGLTWSYTTLPASQTSGRHRIKSREHLRGTTNWWEDKVLISQCFTIPEDDPNYSRVADFPRHNCVMISSDKGETWSEPLFLYETGYDGGYGDFLYNPIKKEFVSITNHAPTSMIDSSLYQINWKLFGV